MTRIGPRRRLAAGQVTAVAAVAVVVVASWWSRRSSRSRSASGDRKPVAGHPVRPRVVPAAVVRQEAVSALLTRRASTEQTGDLAGFLATVDPAVPGLVAEQTGWFNALRSAPVSDEQYVLGSGERTLLPGALAVGPGVVPWTPVLTWRYALTGIDALPVSDDAVLTFGEDAGRWVVVADHAAVSDGTVATPELWDAGAVVSVRTPHCLILSHPTGALPAGLPEVAEGAVGHVTAIWGSDWSQQVAIVVPGSEAETAALMGRPVESLTQIAAVETAETAGSSSGLRRAVGDRVILNPAGFARLGAVGRRVVLTHEEMHVASRAATGPDVPTWLVEGLADYAGFDGSGVAVRVAATELAGEVRAGTVPTGLPVDGDYASSGGLSGQGNPRLGAVYEEGWMAARTIVELSGVAGLVRCYRALGAATGPAADAVDAALRGSTGLDTAGFVARWRADLVAELGGHR